MNQSKADNSFVGYKRIIGMLLWIVAVLVTTLAWAGVSLRDVLAAVGF